MKITQSKAQILGVILSNLLYIWGEIICKLIAKVSRYLS